MTEREREKDRGKTRKREVEDSSTSLFLFPFPPPSIVRMWEIGRHEELESGGSETEGKGERRSRGTDQGVGKPVTRAL